MELISWVLFMLNNHFLLDGTFSCFTRFEHVFTLFSVSLVGLYKNQAGFEETYWSQSSEHYFTGDAGFQDEDGYVYIMTRYGDIINVSGHRFSTGSFEEILSAHPSVAECAVIGVHDPIKGQAPLGLIILKADVSPNDHEKIKAECIQNVLDAVGKVSAFHKVVIVSDSEFFQLQTFV